jgi:hypothetical protein
MSNFFKEKLMKEIGKENISCGHNQNHFEEDFVLTENSLHCDNCFESLIEKELIITSIIKNEIDGSLLADIDETSNEFLSQIESDKYELVSQKIEKIPLPEFLKNYININLNNKKETERDTIVVRIFKEGARLLHTAFSESNINIQRNILPSVRNGESPTYISIRENTTKGLDLVYNVIRENEKEAYLSIDFKNNPYHYNQVNLKKNNRFIYSQKIDNSAIVSFSGLKAGDYSVELSGSDNSKITCITILTDEII